MRSFYIKTLTFFFLLAMGVAGCKKDFLNRQPLDIISSEDVFKDEALTLTYLYNIYDYMPVGYGLYQMEGQNVLSGLGITDLLDGSTDLLRSPSSWNESNSVMIPGLIAATYNPLENWGRSYQAIRKVHNLLNGLSNSPLEEKFKTRVMAEARFVRAFLYFALTRRYGNIPLITKLQSFENVDSLLVAPTPATEVYDFIDQELTAIAEILPSAGDLSPAELGRAT